MDGTRRPTRELLALIVCPSCHGKLEWASAHIDCRSCGRGFEVVDGIPVFADPTSDRSASAEHKRRQIEHFDGVSEEFEIERPHGTTRLYRWLLDEKHRRALSGITSTLPGATALTVCGGSGMDGEYLARAGAQVIVSDLSLAAAFRARERARRHRLDVVSIVADAERLPFSDDAVDVTLVHDGLHHLADPLVGLAEMARVARKAVSITEPARAAATAVAVRLGIAFDQEEAGNTVERLVPQLVVERLSSAGFQTASANRYAMYYRHRPGRLSSALSGRMSLVAAKLIFRAFNAVAGGTGNKLAVVAVRVGGLEPNAPGPTPRETIKHPDQVQ